MGFKHYVMVALIVLAIELAVLTLLIMFGDRPAASPAPTPVDTPSASCVMVWNRHSTLWPKQTRYNCPENIYGRLPWRQ